jgi:hypothetical protein
MPGLRVASTDGAGWTAWTVELALTIACAAAVTPSRSATARTCVSAGTAGWSRTASPDGLAALGVDMSRTAVAARWLTRTAGSGSRPAHTSLPGRRPTARHTSGSPPAALPVLSLPDHLAPYPRAVPELDLCPAALRDGGARDCVAGHRPL